MEYQRTPPVAKQVLSTLFPGERLQEALIAQSIWHPYPTAIERTAWQAIPENVQGYLIARAEQYQGWTWPELPATLFLEFVRDGNRVHYEERYFARRQALLALVMGECVQGQGRFLDEIVNGIWAICEESFWGLPAHNFSARAAFLPASGISPSPLDIGLPDTAYRVIDLFAAETGALLAWTWYLLKEPLAQTLPVVVDRIGREMRERLLDPYSNVEYWQWMGSETSPPNNWNPWIHSNLLAVTLLMEADEQVSVQTVSRILAGLDRFLAGYHADGGCDEGPGYWDNAAGSLFDSLDLLYRASGGSLDAFEIALIQEMGRFILRTHIGGPWYVNFADAAARLTPSGELIYRYGKRIHDPLLMRQGAYSIRYAATTAQTEHLNVANVSDQDRLLFSSIDHYQRVPGRLLPALFEVDSLAEADATAPLLRETWLDGIEVLCAREQAGTERGLFLAAKGGHNAESHNHNDIGTFLVALDGEPVVLDVGVGIYTRKTFNEERYTIWTMRSSYHNLPLINGYEQQAGRKFQARAVHSALSEEQAELSLDLTEAYPEQADILQWQRTLRLERRDRAQIILNDRYHLGAVPQTLALHLMIRNAVELEHGLLRCSTATRPLEISYDPQLFQAHVERIEITDARIAATWGRQIFRIILACQPPLQAKGEIRLVIRAG